MPCKGICPRYKASGSPANGRYSSNQKRCKECEIFLFWTGIRCPCCGLKLRTKPRNKLYKEKNRARLEHQQPLLIKMVQLTKGEKYES